MRCEDFPCCGHYEQATGETFCYEATRTPKQRALDEEQDDINRRQAALDKKIERAAEMRAAEDREHDDDRCGDGEQMCFDCLVEAHDAEDNYDPADYEREYA